MKCYSAFITVYRTLSLLFLKSGQVVALKKVALRKIEDGIPNTALREIKALREIEDSPYVSIW